RPIRPARPAPSPPTPRPECPPERGPIMADRFDHRLTVTGETADRFDEILTPAALAFVAKLDNAFAERRRELLDERRRRRERIAAGEETLDFLAETAAIR